MRRGAPRWLKMTKFAESYQIFIREICVNLCPIFEGAVTIKKMPGAGLKRVILLTTFDLDTAIAILDNTEGQSADLNCYVRP